MVATKIKLEKYGEVIVSLYLPIDSEEPLPGANMENLMDYARQYKLDVVVGADTNAHHLSWGSKDNNTKCKKLFDYLCTTELDIANIGNTPTFRTLRGESSMDVTLCTLRVGDMIRYWHVSDEPSLSNRAHIYFEVDVEKSAIRAYRDSKVPIGDLTKRTCFLKPAYT